MNRRQLARQIAYLLGKATWTQAPQERVFAAVEISELPPEIFVPDTKTPFALVSSLGSRSDPEHPERDRESRFRVTIVAKGIDRHGSAAIIGRDRGSQGSSDGAGVLELEEAVRAALGRLGPEDGVLAAATANTTSQVLAVQGVEVQATRFELVAFNVPAAPSYPSPSRFLARGGIGQATLFWDPPPDRFDLVGVVIQRSDPGGLAPLTVYDGQRVATAGPQATSIIIGTLAAGTYIFTAFGAFDDLATTPARPHAYSAPVFATVVVS